MTTNFFFNQYNSLNEQTLLENLIIESIKNYGVDMVYLPRIEENHDTIYETSDIVTFKDAYTLEMYIKSVDGFGGDGNFLSKFGLEIRDQIVFTVANKRFKEEITARDAKLNRPREGDLIWFPINNRLFEIKFSDSKSTFYQMGTLQTFNLTCELFEYSSERFETGISEIDRISKFFSQDTTANTIPAMNGTINLAPLEDNTDVKKEANVFIRFDDSNPFGEGV